MASKNTPNCRQKHALLYVKKPETAENLITHSAGDVNRKMTAFLRALGCILREVISFKALCQ